MRTNASIAIAVAAALAAATALAQVPQPASGAADHSLADMSKDATEANTSKDVAENDPGFFRPKEDPALTSFRPAEAIEEAEAGNGSTQPGGDGVAMPDARAELEQAQLASDRRTEALSWAQQQLDRAEREHEEALERTAEAPLSVGAAFTGSTDPRDR